MRINFKKIKALTVTTASGLVLGHVKDAVIDSEAQVLVQYEVHSPILRHETYLINREQVVRITESEMVVDDSIASLTQKKSRLEPLPVSPTPAVLREDL